MTLDINNDVESNEVSILAGYSHAYSVFYI